jgi:hypothetical protein
VRREAPTPPARLLALQRSAGNRATARLLQRFPDAADIDTFWSELVGEVEREGRVVKDLDCRAAANRVAAIGQSKARKRKIKPNQSPLTGPLYRIASDDLDATPTEVKEAYGRGWRVRDRVVSFSGREYMRVHSGGADGAEPTVRFFPLLPGMMIYSAEDAGWKDKGQGTYRWYLRHAAIYKGDGWIRENFGAQLRNIKQGHRSEDRTLGAYGADSHPKFLTTLAIYDPFHAYRSKADKAWLDRGAMTTGEVIMHGAAEWLSGATAPVPSP